MSIVVIELDQSAAGKTYRARQSPTPHVQTGLRFVPLKRPPRPCSSMGNGRKLSFLAAIAG